LEKFWEYFERWALLLTSQSVNTEIHSKSKTVLDDIFLHRLAA
jgi:hypothetical protein